MTSKARVLVVGADGADPNSLARLMSQGKLPHFASLCKFILIAKSVSTMYSGISDILCIESETGELLLDYGCDSTLTLSWLPDTHSW